MAEIISMNNNMSKSFSLGDIFLQRTHLGVALNNMISYFAWVIPCITNARYAEFIHDQSHLLKGMEPHKLQELEVSLFLLFINQ